MSGGEGGGYRDPKDSDSDSGFVKGRGREPRPRVECTRNVDGPKCEYGQGR